MNESNGYAVFFFPQALEALGDAIKPYLQDGTAGQHVVCSGIDTGGSLIEMTLSGKAGGGEAVEIELMVPSAMVRMIVSAHSDEMFGFGPYAFRSALQTVLPVAEAAQETASPPPAAPAEPQTAEPAVAATKPA